MARAVSLWAHTSNDDRLRCGLYNGASRRHGIGGRPGGRGDDDPSVTEVTRVRSASTSSSTTRAMEPLEVATIVRARSSLTSFSPETPARPASSAVRWCSGPGLSWPTGWLRALQLGHKAHTAHVHPQNGDPVKGGIPGGMEQDSISAGADEQVGGGQLPGPARSGLAWRGTSTRSPFLGTKGRHDTVLAPPRSKMRWASKAAFRPRSDRGWS